MPQQKRSTPCCPIRQLKDIRSISSQGADAAATDRKVNEAERLLTQAAEHWEDEPPWLYFYEGPWMRLQVGALQVDLGRYSRAVELLTAALDELDPAYVRDAAWYRAILARAEFEAGDAERAAATVRAVLPDARATNAYAVEHLKGTIRKMRLAGVVVCDDSLSAHTQ